MSVWSLTYRQSVFKWQQSNKHLSEFYPRDGGENQLAWLRNETTSLSPDVYNCHPRRNKLRAEVTQAYRKFREVWTCSSAVCERTGCPGGVKVRALDLRLRRSRVWLAALRFQLTTLGKLFTHMCFRHQAVYFGTGQAAVMSCGWEGNRRCGVALVMRHRLQWSIQSTYGLKA